ncbi:hypothetical protein QTP70_026050 [Hemibagrus guttatus]|uniref:Uncharacterized protein n=1 Tax=Hemibagrus guttatus TaxID=175788 RepID=A0AAE0UIQ1_9TELE|nr:hypothetical protein QTP70_026050 [Hemibagrus guttatus]
MEAPPPNLEDLKDLLLTSWCQIPRHTFRDLVESMPRRVRAVLAAKGDRHNIRQVVIMLCLIENISENQGEGVQDSGESGHAVWFRDSVTEEETGVRARGSRAEDVEVLFGSDKIGQD